MRRGGDGELTKAKGRAIPAREMDRPCLRFLFMMDVSSSSPMRNMNKMSPKLAKTERTSMGP